MEGRAPGSASRAFRPVVATLAAIGCASAPAPSADAGAAGAPAELAITFDAAAAAELVITFDAAAAAELVITFDAAAAGAASGGIDARIAADAREGEARIEVAGGASALAAGRRPRIDVAMRGEERPFGLRHFSLRDPAAFDLGRTSAVYERLRQVGVLAPRTRLVRVRANGASLGPMALVEDFSKELVESQRRREGVLFRLDADALPVARLDVYGGKKVAKDDRLSVERDTAAGLLQAFLVGSLPADQVFDVGLWAGLLNVAEQEGAFALLAPAALRFYFNPVTQRIEPVAVDERIDAAPEPRAAAAAWSAQLRADAGLRAALEAERARPPGAVSAPRPASGAERAAAPALVPSPDAAPRVANPVPTARLEDALARHPFLAWDPRAHTLLGRPGAWDVGGSLVLPEGVGLELGPATTLRFGAGELLVATGPLRFRGTADRPVVLEGRDGGPWGGIVVLSSPEAHEWSHVRVRDTAGVDRDGWHLTGGVTFRESELHATDAGFSGNRAEDALNLIRSRFALRDVVVEGAASDGFDCDFCEGRLDGGVFRDIGGDGLDVSGSRVEADSVRFEGIHDKALSVGEASRVTARRARIERVGTALASKDGSEVVFEDSDVADAQLAGIMAYVKKDEYGVAAVVARDVRMVRVARPTLAQHGSRISLDGVEQPTEALDVEALYEQGTMAK